MYIKDKSSKSEYLMAIFAVMCWGTIPALGKLLLGSYSEMAVLFYIASFATIALLIFNIVTGNLKDIKKLTGKDYFRLSWLGLLGMFVYTFLYNVGLARMPAQECCIINYMWPIMVMLFAVPVLKEKMTWRKLFAVLISFWGIVVIVTKLNFADFHMDSPVGVAACLIAAVSYGLFSNLNKKYDYDQHIAMMWFFFVTAILAGILMTCTTGFIGINSMGDFAKFAVLGMLDNGIAYLMWNIALVRGNTAKIANFAYITPFMAIVFSVLILGEAFSIFSLIGLGFILLGIFIQLKGK